MQDCFKISRSRCCRRVLFLALFATSVLSDGVFAEMSATEYYARTWTTDQGLPHNSVSAVLQDSIGLMWFATVGGLARFDGREFREVRPPVEFNQAGFNIRDFAEERPGVLVVLPAGDTLFRLTAATWSIHPSNAVLTQNHDAPTDVHVDQSGNLWIATAKGRLVRWSQNGEHKIFDLDGGVASRSRRITFASDARGGIWIAGDGLWFTDPSGNVKRFESAGNEARQIAPSRNHGIWLWNAQQLQRLDDGKITVIYDVPPGSNWGTIRHLFEDRHGTLWLATTRNGVLRLAGGQATRAAEFFSTAFIAEDREGSIWVATNGSGVGQLREKSYRLFNNSNGLEQQIVSSLDEDSMGNVWLANRSGGLVAIGPSRVPQPSGLGGTRMFANVICADAGDRLWFGGGRNGLSRWTPGRSEPEQMPAPALNLHLLFRTKKGDVWFAGEPSQLGFYRGDILRTFTPGDGFAPQEIRAIAEDEAGRIWVGGRNGDLLCWDGTRFEQIQFSPGMRRGPIHAIYADAAGHLWIATAQGLILKDGAAFRLITEANGLADDIIHEMLEDQEGYLWFASRRGFFYAAKADLLAAARDPSRRVESYRLGSNQGLVGITPIGDYHPTACRSRDGSLWFATAQGAIVINPSTLPRDLPPPPVLIDEIRLDGMPVTRDEPFQIPSGQHTVDFRFAALSYVAPEDVVLRHQIEGLDGRWIETSVDRIASYSNLRPGTYRLKAIARNSTGRWNMTGTTLSFTVIPAWWETMLFRAGAGISIIGGVAWLVRAIVHRRLQNRLQLLEQQNAVQKERTRIARDLHDDLGVNLTEVGLLADRLSREAPQEFATKLSGLAWRVRRAATDLSGIVWTMNAEHSSLKDLAVFLRRYVERLFRNTSTRCLVLGVDSIPAVSLAPGVQHEVLSATKEALNNVLKHARATEAQLEMRYADGIFELEVSDNGVGFLATPETLEEGNGLRNMRDRMDEIDGTFQFASVPSNGTRVIFKVRVSVPQLCR